jgi:hypothetical protein
VCLAAGVLSLVTSSPVETVTPGLGSSLEFDGIDDFAFVSRSASLEPVQITIELWAKLEAEQTWNTRLVRKAAHFNSGYFLSADQDNTRAMHLRVQNDQSVVVAADPLHHSAYVGEWHHFAGVYRLYSSDFLVDGVLVNRVYHSMGAMDHDPLANLYIGAGLPSPSASEYFKGRIDEVRIWKYARRPEQVHRDMHRSLSGFEYGLVGNWKFDEGSGQIVHDASRARNHAQLGATSGPDASDPTWVADNAPAWTPDG